MEVEFGIVYCKFIIIIKREYNFHSLSWSCLSVSPFLIFAALLSAS